jgi:antitoxin component of RelBE/YafQ-DinJ toxin-antitoxin module
MTANGCFTIEFDDPAPADDTLDWLIVHKGSKKWIVSCIVLYYNVDIMSNTAALTIRTDPKTKKVIADFASSVGLSTSAFATAILLQAVREQRVLLTPTLEPTPYLEKIMRKAAADRKAGRNISGPFDSAEEMVAELEK